MENCRYQHSRAEGDYVLEARRMGTSHHESIRISEFNVAVVERGCVFVRLQLECLKLSKMWIEGGLIC